MASSQIIEISQQEPAIQRALLELNNDHALETSHLSPLDWQALVDNAFSATCINEAAFLIAFDQDAHYDNTNFNWFGTRYDRFVYVDRIVVSESLRGAGAAQKLYEHLFALVASAGRDWVVCEINSDPPNPISDAFHEKMGFKEVGHAVLADRQKSVRYLARNIHVNTD